MMDPARQIVDEILRTAASARQALLQARCGEDERLRARVQELLVARVLAPEDAALVATTPGRVPLQETAGAELGEVAARAARALDPDAPSPSSLPSPGPGPGATVEVQPPDALAGSGAERPGDRIGPYKLLQLIGEGGFGSVYMAEQVEPVQRRVALKIIKLGMDTRQVIARFEAERQALAILDHPNIAKVLDAGATTTGRPYFVMELVRGVSITEYCDTHRLTVPERLALFANVCLAVHHAHQKGIIHRDLKPSNVLVTLHDSRPVPKVIDFGIAKATHQRLTEKTLFTEFRQFVGTPQYMSPEQAEMSGLDVDTRSDVYSLGVILYELLTGVTPFALEMLLAGGYADLSRTLREQDAPPLSTRFTALGEQRNAIARRRQSEAQGLVQQLRGELDWIVGKALERDRTRRYETARELALDLERCLAREPVAAAPRSTLYRLRTFVRRHRIGVLAASAVAVALLLGLAGTTVGMLRARRELARSREIGDFLTQLHVGFDVTRAGESSIGDGAQRIVERCQELFGDDHVLAGSLLFAHASILASAGRPEEAERVLERCLAFQRKALGAGHESVAATLLAQGKLLAERGATRHARAAYEEALRISQERLGANSARVGAAARQLMTLLVTGGAPEDAARTDELFSIALAAWSHAHGEDDIRTVMLRAEYGTWLQSTHRLAEARPVLTRAVELGRPLRHQLGDLWLSALNALTVVYILEGDIEPAKRLYAELLDLLRERGIGGTALITQLLRHAAWLRSVDDLAGARASLEQAQELTRELSADHELHRAVLRALEELSRAPARAEDGQETP